MRNDEIYDSFGQDGIDNKAAFERLPYQIQYFISAMQNQIYSKVVNTVRKEYGEEGLKDLVKSSGFRSIATNTRHRGVVDSLHLFGAAIDFLKVGIFEKIPIPVCCTLELIDSGKCWHIQLKRGK